MYITGFQEELYIIRVLFINIKYQTEIQNRIFLKLWFYYNCT